jgi:hypothetical protein
MKIVINNVKFGYDDGCRILKLKYDTSPYPELNDIWDDIVPITFKNIAKLRNIEQRRIAIGCLGIDRLVKEIQPKLLGSKTLSKKTTWVDVDGNIVRKEFKDTYELYEVERELLVGEKWGDNFYYVKCKDTSTDREYLIWVDLRSVFAINGGYNWEFEADKVNPIQAIAWTIQTTIPQGSIKELIRQGDCVLIEPNGKYKPLITPRHLTEKEYKTLLVAES